MFVPPRDTTQSVSGKKPAVNSKLKGDIICEHERERSSSPRSVLHRRGIMQEPERVEHVINCSSYTFFGILRILTVVLTIYGASASENKRSYYYTTILFDVLC